jgi:ribose 5-phosphate isomerase B
MKIVIGSDHAGFALKSAVGDAIRGLGHELLDVGAFNENPCDYPDIAELVARAVADGKSERGVLIDGSGVGMVIAANKIPGIRAAACHDTCSAHQGVEHDNMNVLVIGARIVGSNLAVDLVVSYLGANFTNETRHVRRLNKVLALESRMFLEAVKK